MEPMNPMVRRSDEIKNLAAALAKAQGAILHAAKDAKNPHYKSDYSTLASIWDACRKPMADNGLSLCQMPSILDGKPVLVSVLMHTSGEWIESTMSLNPTKPDPQGMGSAITYARRQATAAIASVCPADDDGNEASKKPAFDPKKANGAKKTAGQQFTDALTDWFTKHGDGQKITPQAEDYKAILRHPDVECQNVDKPTGAEMLGAVAFIRKNMDNDPLEFMCAPKE